jgi:hypothetical protein
MKLLYETASGQVLARYGDDTEFNPTPQDGQSIIDIPETVAIPDAVIRVVQSSSDHGDPLNPEFVIDQEAVTNLWRSIKAHRNRLLKESDWICSVTDYCPPNKEEWIQYRQGLRDITSQPNPFRLMWPREPSVSVVSASDPQPVL